MLIFMSWMEKDWILLHFDAIFDHLPAAGRKELISLKNKEINLHPTAKTKKQKFADQQKSGIPDNYQH